MRFRTVLLRHVNSEQTPKKDRNAAAGFTACSRAGVFFRVHSSPLRKVPPTDDARESSLPDCSAADNNDEDKFEELPLNELLRAQGHQHARSGENPGRAAL